MCKKFDQDRKCVDCGMMGDWFIIDYETKTVRLKEVDFITTDELFTFLEIHGLGKSRSVKLADVRFSGAFVEKDNK